MTDEIKAFLTHMEEAYENVQNVVDTQDEYYIMGMAEKFSKNKKGD